jgi:hypothetical protein
MKKSYEKPEVVSISLTALESVSAGFETFQGLTGIGTDVGITSYVYMSTQA